MKHLPFIQKFLLKAMEVHFDFQTYFKDEKVKKSRISRLTQKITLRQKLIITADSELKNLKQSSLSRVKDIYANYIELDLTSFTEAFC